MNLGSRKSIRLKGYDYSQSGWYFITLCTKNREMFFGDVADGEMILNDAGIIVKKCWSDIPGHYPNVCLDDFVVMPNHAHGVINIVENDKNKIAGTKIVGDHNVRAKNISPLPKNNKFQSPSKTIGSIIRGFKIGVTKWFRQNTDIYTVWQRNYYEHIIRDESELNRIRKYIIENPFKWQDDKYYKIKNC